MDRATAPNTVAAATRSLEACLVFVSAWAMLAFMMVIPYLAVVSQVQMWILRWDRLRSPTTQACTRRLGGFWTDSCRILAFAILLFEELKGYPIVC
jgi:hypothetical protein